MMMDNEHTKEFDEVMRRPPNAITRYGHWLLLLLLAALAISTWYCRHLLF
jgi:hypothetical protein